MILDNYTLLSDDQDLSQVAGTYYSDILDLHGDGYTTSQDAPLGVTPDLGKGYPVEILAQVTEDFASGGAATLVATLQTSITEAFTVPIDLAASAAFALADLVAGKNLLPEHVPYGAKQYLRIKYVIGTATTTAGTVTAGIVCGHQSNK